MSKPNSSRNLPGANRCGPALITLQDRMLDATRKDLRCVTSYALFCWLFSRPCLRGPAVPAAIVRDGAKPVRGKKEELLVPRVRIEWPAVTEHDGLSGAPILVKNLRSVFRRDRRHVRSP